MQIFEAIAAVKVCSIIYLIALVVAFLIVALMVFGDTYNYFWLGLWIAAMLTMSVASIIIISHVTPNCFNKYGQNFYDNFMLGILASTLPSTGFLIAYWYYCIGNGDMMHTFFKAMLLPVVVLLLFAFLSLATMSTFGIVIYYIFEYALWIIGIGVAIGMRIAYGGSDY